MRTGAHVCLMILCVLCLVGVAAAATPPPGINYQGVLRDAADKPLSGTYTMPSGSTTPPAAATCS